MFDAIQKSVNNLRLLFTSCVKVVSLWAKQVPSVIINKFIFLKKLKKKFTSMNVSQSNFLNLGVLLDLGSQIIYLGVETRFIWGYFLIYRKLAPARPWVSDRVT